MTPLQLSLAIPPALAWLMIGYFWLRGYTGGMMGLSLGYLGMSSIIAVIGIIANPTSWSLLAFGFVFFCYICLLASILFYFDNPEDNNTTYD